MRTLRNEHKHREEYEKGIGRPRKELEVNEEYGEMKEE
jgi:hypothetical protein